MARILLDFSAKMTRDGEYASRHVGVPSVATVVY